MDDSAISPDTLPGLLKHCVGAFPETRALFNSHAKPIVEITYGQMGEEIAAVGAGLLKAGIKPGDHVALFSDNQPRWLMTDLAITGIGAVDVPRGSDTATPEFEFILQHSQAVAAVVENRRLYERLISSPVFQALQVVVLLDDYTPQAEGAGPRVLSYADVRQMGEPVKQEFWRAAAAVEPNTLGTIVYTSGTTGSPKGVMLTHGNLMTHPKYVDVGYNPQPGDIQMSILPAWHAYERAAEYYGISKGNTLAYSDKRYIKEDFVRLCPHLLPCVPRIWEMVYKTIYHKINSATPRQQKLFNFFISAGRQYVYARREVNGERVSAEKVQPLARFANLLKMLALAPIYSLGDKLVFAKMRQITGGRLRAAISGGGSLAPYLDDFFEIVGIPILNGYGLTETAPVLTLRTLQHNVRGSVGRPLSHTQISIRTETGDELPQGQAGEIWARGPQIMLGYYQNPEATAKVLKDGGWFCTGDLGWVTSGGDVIISGRAKDTIVLSSGENVEPEPIEDACRKSPLVQQIVIVGQDQKTLGALVVPDFAELATQLSLPGETPSTEIVEREDAKKIIKSALAQVMATEGRFKAAESISKVFLLPEAFTEKNGMMTSTMKIKRNVVAERHKEQIKALFEN